MKVIMLKNRMDINKIFLYIILKNNHFLSSRKFAILLLLLNYLLSNPI